MPPLASFHHRPLPRKNKRPLQNTRRAPLFPALPVGDILPAPAPFVKPPAVSLSPRGIPCEESLTRGRVDRASMKVEAARVESCELRYSYFPTQNSKPKTLNLFPYPRSSAFICG
jgi:hypothetical protein